MIMSAEVVHMGLSRVIGICHEKLLKTPKSLNMLVFSQDDVRQRWFSFIHVYIYFFNLILIYTGIPIETQYLIYRRNLFWTNNYHTKGKNQLFSGI